MHKNLEQVSVIIPVYNTNFVFLKNILETMISNEDTLIKEVILVDDDSVYSLENYFAVFREISPKIRIIRQSNKGPGGARNAGAKIAQSNILVFIDHDCVPGNNWIKNLITPMIEKKLVAVGGTVLTHKEDNILSKFADFGEFLRKPVKNKEGITNIITANSAFLKVAFDRVGGFCEKLSIAAEDLDFTYKLSLAGYGNKFFYATDAIVFHKHRTRFNSFFWQQFGYGFGAVSHCLLRKRDPSEIGFLFPTPINFIKYAITHFFVSIFLVFKIDKKYGKFNKWIAFPFLNFIREMAVLTGGAKAYYTQNKQFTYERSAT